MKKLVILFLLTALVGASVFAIEGVGDITAKLSVDAQNVSDSARKVEIKPWVSFSRDLIENLNLYLELGLPINTGPLNATKIDVQINEFDLKLTYGGIAAGPGALGFYLNNKFVFPFDRLVDTWTYGFTLAATYGGIAAGPGSIDTELGGDFAVYAAKKVDFKFSDIYLALTYNLDMGVAITLKPVLAINPTVDFGGLYAKVGYANDAFGAGLEIDKFPKNFKGFPVKLYGEAYLLGGPLTVGGHLSFGNIGGSGSIGITPGVYVSYAF